MEGTLEGSSYRLNSSRKLIEGTHGGRWREHVEGTYVGNSWRELMQLSHGGNSLKELIGGTHGGNS